MTLKCQCHQTFALFSRAKPYRSHNPAIYKYEAIKALRQLKTTGFTHFAIEMLPRSMQEKIEFYQRTGKATARACGTAPGFAKRIFTQGTENRPTTYQLKQRHWNSLMIPCFYLSIKCINL